MPQDTQCPKCGSADVIPGIDVVADVSDGMGPLMLALEARPTALVFKGLQKVRLYATVCGSCGFTELCAPNARELLGAYRKRSPEEQGEIQGS
jgi:predicted nucleic-acid-binding Zn-ribbon protein